MTEIFSHIIDFSVKKKSKLESKLLKTGLRIDFWSSMWPAVPCWKLVVDQILHK